MAQENLLGKIIFLNLKRPQSNGLDGQLSYRMFLVEDKTFTKKDAFLWAEEMADQADAIITKFEII